MVEMCTEHGKKQRGAMTSELLGQRSCQSLSISSLNLQSSCGCGTMQKLPNFPVLRLLPLLMSSSFCNYAHTYIF